MCQVRTRARTCVRAYRRPTCRCTAVLHCTAVRLRCNRSTIRGSCSCKRRNTQKSSVPCRKKTLNPLADPRARKTPLPARFPRDQPHSCLRPYTVDWNFWKEKYFVATKNCSSKVKIQFRLLIQINCELGVQWCQSNARLFRRTFHGLKFRA